MSVYKPARSPYFHFDFVWDGRRFFGSTGCRTKREALRHEERVRATARTGDRGRQSITIDGACGLYAEKVQDQPSWRHTKRIIWALLDDIGLTAQLASIDQRRLLAVVARRRIGRSNASVNREIEVWRAIWRWAAKNRFEIGEMPDWGALMLKVVRKDPRELSAAEETALFAELRPDLFEFCTFALKTGWRQAELLGLRWKDVDLGGAVARTRIKGGDVVARPLTQEMVVIIANQPKVGPFVFTYVAARTKPAFTDKLGRAQPARRAGDRYPMTAQVLRKPWAAAKAAAGVEAFRFHDLRHTRGTRILRATGNLAAAKEALKHRSIKTTLRYAHATDDDVRRALEVSESRTGPELPDGKRRKA